MSYEEQNDIIERQKELQRKIKFNSLTDNKNKPDETIQRNEKQNQTYHKTIADQFLNDKQTYHVKVTHLNNYVDERKYYGNMIKSVYSKQEREQIAYKQLCDLLGKENVTIEDAEKYLQTSNNKKYSEKGSVSSEIMQHNYYRSYITLRNYALANTHIFKSFITLTFEDNITSSEEANEKFHIWKVRVKKQFPDFAYLGVPERQKRGAIHFHLMTNIPVNSDLIPLRKEKALWNPELKRDIFIKYYDIKYWTILNNGYSTAFDLDMTDENFSVVSYLSKYFWKDKDDSFFGKKKVFRSQNLIKPLVEFYNINSEAYNRYKQSLTDAVLIKSTMIESKTDYCPDLEINEFRKIKK